MDTAFRKIDIDQFDEDAVQPEDLYEPDPRSPQQALADAQTKASESRQLLTRGDVSSALTTLLHNPPYGPPTALLEARKATLSAVTDVLASTRTADVPGVVARLTPEEQDTLMKFVYKGMSRPEDGNSAVLLTWHEKLTEVAGVGTIVRVMTDRRQI